MRRIWYPSSLDLIFYDCYQYENLGWRFFRLTANTSGVHPPWLLFTAIAFSLYSFSKVSTWHPRLSVMPG